MWLRLAVFALCGLPALWADVCDSLPTGPPKWSEYWPDSKDDPHPLSFRLSVKQGGPAFRITVRPFSHEIFAGWQQSTTKLIHAGDIEVARCQDGKQLQSLPIMVWQPIDFGASFHAEDINFDGYLDFSVLSEFAGTFKSRSYWVYDPASGLFVQNELAKELSENCLGAAGRGGCWKSTGIRVDPTKHELSTGYLHGCPGDTAEGDRYTVKDNRLIVIHKEAIQSAANGVCTVTVSDRIDGTMRVTEIKRFDPQGHPVK